MEHIQGTVIFTVLDFQGSVSLNHVGRTVECLKPPWIYLVTGGNGPVVAYQSCDLVIPVEHRELLRFENYFCLPHISSYMSKPCIDIYILPDGIIEDIREFFQIEDSHFEHFSPKRFK